MNTQDIRKESNLLYKALLPLLQLGRGFDQWILTDLAKIMQFLGRSKGTVTTNELLGFLVVYALVKNDKPKLNAAINQWDSSDEVRLNYGKETLQLLIDLAGNHQESLILSLPSMLNRLDEAKGTHLLDSSVNAIYRFAQVMTKADGQVTMQELDALSEIWKQLHSYQMPPQATEQAIAVATSSSKDGLERVMDELNQLIGMEEIKEEIRTLTNFLKVQKVRSERGLATTSVSLHSVFCGPPGTGKTTVARLLGRIFKELDFLAKGQLIETDRAGMVADHIGGTSKKVDGLVNQALDGVLFIDEAYALKPVGSTNDFGQEAIDVLIKRMEDYRDRLVVIVAGYSDEMTRFIDSNPGLKSRFNRYFYFNDYTPDELLAMFQKRCKDSHFNLTDAASEKVKELLTTLYDSRDRAFGNGRLVRNLFEKTIEQQANRLAVMTELTDEVLTTIEVEDIPSIQTIGPQQPTPTPAVEVWLNASDQAHLNQLVDRLSQTLQPQGISVKASLKHNNLQILFEASEIPNLEAMVAITSETLQQGQLDTISRIKLYGRQRGDDFPAWHQEFTLRSTPSEVAISG